MFGVVFDTLSIGEVDYDFLRYNGISCKSIEVINEFDFLLFL